MKADMGEVGKVRSFYAKVTAIILTVWSVSDKIVPFIKG
jgi:hypothetical protein